MESKIQFDEISICYAYLRAGPPGRVMLDVGAFRGGHLRPFLQDGWRVHAFEPDPAKQAILAELAREFPALAIHPDAVSDREAEGIPFFTSTLSAGISSLRAFHDSHRESVKVATTTLDVFCAAHSLDGINFLKIDAEGEDLAVLRGLPWDRVRPEFIMCEFDEAKPNCPKLAEIAAYLKERRYTLVISEWFPLAHYGAGGGHAWRRFASADAPLADPNAWGNVLAFRDGVDALRFASAVASAVAPTTPVAGAVSAAPASGRVTPHAIIASLEEDVRFLKSSRSWRWTKPLRSLEAAAGRLLRPRRP